MREEAESVTNKKPNWNYLGTAYTLNILNTHFNFNSIKLEKMEHMKIGHTR